MKVKTIASSSAGCGYIVEIGKSQILIEAGVSIRKIRQSAGGTLKNIICCLVSHEHGDHCKYLKDIAWKATIPIYCTKNTREKLSIPVSINIDNLGEIYLSVQDIKISIIKLFHDVPCFGFLISKGKKRLFYASDTVKLPYKIHGLTHLMIEANFDFDLISKSDRADFVVLRTVKTHLDFDSTVAFIRNHPDLEEIHLLHLSADHANQDDFLKKVANLTGVPVYIAQR